MVTPASSTKVAKVDGGPAAREESNLLTAWVWIEDPDKLPRSILYTFFTARAGQAM